MQRIALVKSMPSVGRCNALNWGMHCIAFIGLPTCHHDNNLLATHGKLRFLGTNYGKNRSFFGKTASLYRKTTFSGKINCKFAADKLALSAK